jgi:hypothetical protein
VERLAQSARVVAAKENEGAKARKSSKKAALPAGKWLASTEMGWAGKLFIGSFQEKPGEALQKCYDSIAKIGHSIK